MNGDGNLANLFLGDDLAGPHGHFAHHLLRHVPAHLHRHFLNDFLRAVFGDRILLGDQVGRCTWTAPVYGSTTGEAAIQVSPRRVAGGWT
jgi:hypothetical protein